MLRNSGLIILGCLWSVRMAIESKSVEITLNIYKSVSFVKTIASIDALKHRFDGQPDHSVIDFKHNVINK